MKKTLLLIFVAIQFGAFSQAIINSWKLNVNGAYASYWENTTGNPTTPTWLFHNTTDSADILKECYTTDSVWISSDGMTDNMGKYLNPGTCLPQNYVYRFPRNPTVPTTKTTSPKGGAIGCLINGIP